MSGALEVLRFICRKVLRAKSPSTFAATPSAKAMRSVIILMGRG